MEKPNWLSHCLIEETVRSILNELISSAVDHSSVDRYSHKTEVVEPIDADVMQVLKVNDGKNHVSVLKDSFAIQHRVKKVKQPSVANMIIRNTLRMKNMDIRYKVVSKENRSEIGVTIGDLKVEAVYDSEVQSDDSKFGARNNYSL